MWKAFGYRKKIKWYMAARWRRMFEGGSITSFWISGGIPGVLCISACIFPLSPEISWEAQNSVFPWQFSSPLVPLPQHSQFHYYLSRDQKDYSHHPFEPHQNPGPHSSFLISVTNQVYFCMSFVLASLPTRLNSKLLECSRALPKLPIAATSSLNVPLFSCLIKA